MYLVNVGPVGGVDGWSAAEAVQVAAVRSEPRIAAESCPSRVWAGCGRASAERGAKRQVVHTLSMPDGRHVTGNGLADEVWLSEGAFERPRTGLRKWGA